jgi:hypothetical protein
LEKFPRLNVIHVEADGGWVPYWLQRMEQHWDFSGNAEHEYLKLRPTEYFKRNVCVAFRGDEPTLKAAVDLAGADNFTWHTDYLHPDGTYPLGIDAIIKQPISDDMRHKISGTTPPAPSTLVSYSRGTFFSNLSVSWERGWRKNREPLR